MYRPDYSSILAYLFASSKAWSENELMVIRRRIKKEVVYYKQLPELICRFEAWLTKEKISQNEKILFWGMNSPEYSIALLSCMGLNRVVIPIDSRSSIGTIQAILEETQPKFACISKYFKNDFLEKNGITVFYIEDLLDIVGKESPKKTPKGLLRVRSYVNLQRMVELVFTSGTTGSPKGVVMRQSNLLANLKSVESSLPDLTNSRVISILPLSHMFEQIVGLLLPIGYGTTIYYVPRINSFRLLQAFTEYKPTHLIFVPQMLKIFWEKIEDKAKLSGRYSTLLQLMKVAQWLSMSLRKVVFRSIHDIFGGSVRFIACGGAPLDKGIGKNWFSIGMPIIEGYGATEVTAIATVNSFDSPMLGSVGTPIPGVDITFTDEGEICIQSDSVSSGYYKKKEKTKEVFTKKGYKTGDIGAFDAQGNLRIVGRNVFKIVLASGEKVYVEDLEAKILEHPRVKEVCVVAKSSPDGDTIHAYFILKKDDDGVLKTLVADINDTLESKQQIFSYALWAGDDFPRTPTLKIDRKTVFAVANAHQSIADVAQPDEDVVYSIHDVLDVLSKVSGIDRDRIALTDTLAGDLDIDSLTRVEVVALTEEHLGILLDEGKITAKTTVSELIEMAKVSEVAQDVPIPMWQFSPWGEMIHQWAVNYFLIPLHSSIISLSYPQKHVPYIKPGSIVIFNHPGILDGVCVMRTLVQQGNIRTVTNAGANFWEKKSFLSRWLEVFVGGIPLYESGRKLLKVLQVDSDLLQRGYHLLFAPQGGLQTSDVEQPFKIGIGFVVQQLGHPVYIVKIEGYRSIWPVPAKGFETCTLVDLLPRKRGTATIKVSEVIQPDWGDMTPIQITNFLEEKYRAL